MQKNRKYLFLQRYEKKTNITMKKNLFHVFALSYRYDGRQGDYGGFYYYNTRHSGMILS